MTQLDDARALTADSMRTAVEVLAKAMSGRAMAGLALAMVDEAGAVSLLRVEPVNVMAELHDAVSMLALFWADGEGDVAWTEFADGLAALDPANKRFD